MRGRQAGRDANKDRTQNESRKVRLTARPEFPQTCRHSSRAEPERRRVGQGEEGKGREEKGGEGI